VYREALYLRCQLFEDMDRPTGDYRTLAVHRIRGLRLCRETYDTGQAEDRQPILDFLIMIQSRFESHFRMEQRPHEPAAEAILMRLPWQKARILNRKGQRSCTISLVLIFCSKPGVSSVQILFTTKSPDCTSPDLSPSTNRSNSEISERCPVIFSPFNSKK
jgi:hypothetical protein